MANLLKLDLIRRYVKPAILLNSKINCLIDTGADTPVWTMGEKSLIHDLKAEPVRDKRFLLSGFGKEPEIVPVYQIPEIVIKSEEDDDELVFKNMLIACTLRPTMTFPLIIPATMLLKMNYTIRNIGDSAPKLEIEHEQHEYYVRPVYSIKDDSYIQRVYSFAENGMDG